MKLRRAPYKTRPKPTRVFLLSTALMFFLPGFYAHAEEQVSGFSRPWLYSFINTHEDRFRTEITDRVVDVGLYGAGDEQAVDRARVILYETVKPDVFSERIEKLAVMPEPFGEAVTSAEDIKNVMARINEMLTEFPAELEKAAKVEAALDAGYDKTFPYDFGEEMPLEGMVGDGLREGRSKSWDYMWEAITASISLQAMQVEWRALQIAYPEGAMDIDTSFEDDAQKILNALVKHAQRYQDRIKKYEDRFPDGTFISKPLPEGDAYRMAREIDQYGRVLRMDQYWRETYKDGRGREKVKEPDPALWLWLFEQEPALTEASRLVCVVQSLLLDKDSTVSKEAVALLSDYHAQAKSLVEQAKACMDEYRFTEANDLLLQAMGCDPGNSKTITMLYESASKSRDMALASMALRFLWKEIPEQEFDYLMALNTALAGGDWELLMSVSVAALRGNPNNPDYLYFFAVAAYSWNLTGYHDWAADKLRVQSSPLLKQLNQIHFKKLADSPPFKPNPTDPAEQHVAELWEIVSSETGLDGLGIKLIKDDYLQQVAASPHVPVQVRAFGHRLYLQRNRYNMRYKGVRRDDAILLPVSLRKIESPYSAYAENPLIVLGKDRLKKVMAESAALPKKMGYAVECPGVAIELPKGKPTTELVEKAIQKIDASYLAFKKPQIDRELKTQFAAAKDAKEKSRAIYIYTADMVQSCSDFGGDPGEVYREIYAATLPLMRENPDEFGPRLLEVYQKMYAADSVAGTTAFREARKSFSEEEVRMFKIHGQAFVSSVFAKRNDTDVSEITKIFEKYPPGSQWYTHAVTYVRSGYSPKEVERRMQSDIEYEKNRLAIIAENQAIARRNAARERERAESFERWNNAAIARQNAENAQAAAAPRGYQPRQRGYTWTGKAEVWSSQSSSWSSQQSDDYKADTYRRELNQQINRAMGGY